MQNLSLKGISSEDVDVDVDADADPSCCFSTTSTVEFDVVGGAGSEGGGVDSGFVEPTLSSRGSVAISAVSRVV